MNNYANIILGKPQMYLDYIKMGKIVWIPVHHQRPYHPPAPVPPPVPAPDQDPDIKPKSNPKSHWGHHGYGHHGYGYPWWYRYGYGYPWYGLYTEQRYPYV